MLSSNVDRGPDRPSHVPPSRPAWRRSARRSVPRAAARPRGRPAGRPRRRPARRSPGCPRGYDGGLPSPAPAEPRRAVEKSAGPPGRPPARSCPAAAGTSWRGLPRRQRPIGQPPVLVAAVLPGERQLDQVRPQRLVIAAQLGLGRRLRVLLARLHQIRRRRPVDHFPHRQGRGFPTAGRQESEACQGWHKPGQHRSQRCHGSTSPCQPAGGPPRRRAVRR